MLGDSFSCLQTQLPQASQSAESALLEGLCKGSHGTAEKEKYLRQVGWFGLHTESMAENERFDEVAKVTQ